MKENKKMIYSIIGIFLLIIAVVGGTYAFYLSQVESDQFNGNTANVGLDLSVDKISTGATNALIPLANTPSSLSQAAKGYGNATSSFDNTKSCKDMNGYTVCQVYEITIRNTGTEAISINGGITSLNGENTPNIACAVMNSSISVTNNASCVSSTSLANGVNLVGGGSSTYYIIVYVNETTEEQTDSGSFNGVVTFSTSNGNIEAKF